MLLLSYFLSLYDLKQCTKDDLKGMQDVDSKRHKKVTRRKTPTRAHQKLHSNDDSSSSSCSSFQEERSKVGEERKSEGQITVPPSRTVSCPHLETSTTRITDRAQPEVRYTTSEKGNDTECDFGVKSHDTALTRKTHIRSRSDVPSGSRYPDALVTSQPKPQRAHEKEPTNRRRSLLEEGGSVVVPTTECFFPQPEKGQSLTSFLSSDDFRTCAELDRENAHFYISEALISAVEQIRCNRAIRRAEEEEEDSDEEIQHLKQRIRIRRCERQQEKARQKCFALLSDGKTDTATTSQSASSPQSSVYTGDSNSGIDTEDDDVDQLELSDTNESTLSSMREIGLSLSMASLYSDADIKRATDQESSQEGEMSSAEGVALCLLKKFSEKQLPKASDLEWLVSEQDAPQRLLPLPDSWPVSPDDAEDALCLKKTRLRGTADWAPPRAQIIFDVHPDPNRKLIVARQKYRCAGCGMRTDRGYVGRFRYCEYLGKYFCQCCHGNKMSLVPGRILRRWDFSRYPVSNFSHDLLDRMHSDPLFNVRDVNCALYRRSTRLESTRNLRMQMFYLKDFVATCKMAQGLRRQVEAQPRHWFHEPHLYSIQELDQVKKGHFPEHLRPLVTACIEHVFRCPICKPKGFLCENCRHPTDIIYPFQLRKVTQCRGCGACYHRECFTPGRCAKCARIQERRRRIAETIYSSDEEDKT